MIEGAKSGERIRFRNAPLACAWIFSWLILIVASYGFNFLIARAGLTAFMSGITTLMSYWLGERIRPYIPLRIWLPGVSLLLFSSAAVLLFGRHLGFAQVYFDPDSRGFFVGLSPQAFLAAFLIFNFAVANFPIFRLDLRRGVRAE